MRGLMKNNNAGKSQLQARSKLSYLRGYLTINPMKQTNRWGPGMNVDVAMTSG